LITLHTVTLHLHAEDNVLGRDLLGIGCYLNQILPAIILFFFVLVFPSLASGRYMLFRTSPFEAAWWAGDTRKSGTMCVHGPPLNAGTELASLERALAQAEVA
jgi:hypothetical protein